MQVAHQLFMQRREGGEMPGDAPSHLHARQGELGAGKRLQDARAAGPLCRAGGRAFIEAREGRLRQSAPHLGFQQRQQPQCQGQEPCQPLDVLFLPDNGPLVVTGRK